MRWVLPLGVVSLMAITVSCTRNEAQGGPVTVSIAVEGMHCEGCVRAISASVSALEGVREVAVSLDNKRATVTYEPANVDLARILSAIEAQGYTASAGSGLGAGSEKVLGAQAE